MGRPFFSVIVPAYNAEGHITKLLDSVREQTFRDYELIVVCDSCADRTEEIARGYGARTERVRYNLDGLTRNRGIDMAEGDWILFADDDDRFLHECVFELLSGQVGKHDEDALLFSFIQRTEGYRRSTPDNIQVQCWNKCWRREFLSDIRFSNRHYWSDSDFHNAAMRKPHRFVYWDMPLYYYNFMRPGSVTQQVVDGELRYYGGNVNVITKDTGKEGRT